MNSQIVFWKFIRRHGSRGRCNQGKDAEASQTRIQMEVHHAHRTRAGTQEHVCTEQSSNAKDTGGKKQRRTSNIAPSQVFSEGQCRSRDRTTGRATFAPSGKECNQKISQRLGSDTNYGPAVRHCCNEHYVRHKITTAASEFQ